MNLIEISEQLKDVPDQYLMREVQNPSGSYPAYLVVSELTRRKRMRESAMKQAPTTTVAEDLAQPQRMPARLNAPDMSAPAGLAAMPQASDSLAAMDAMRTTPPQMQEPQRMAGGGLVSFEHGGVVHAFDGLYIGGNKGPQFQTPTPEDMEARQLRDQIRREYRGKASWLGGAMFSPKYGTDIAEQRRQFESERDVAKSILGSLDKLDLESLRNLNEQIQSQKNVDRAERGKMDIGFGPGQFTPQYSAADTRGATPEQFSGNFPTMTAPPAATTPTTREPSAPSAPRTSGMYQINTPFDAQRQLLGSQIAEFQYKSPEELEKARSDYLASGQYEKERPFRYGFMQEDINKMKTDLAGRRESNINEALMQAGLGIMGSRSPYFMQAVSEGGLSGLSAYRQGKKDILEGEKELRQSQANYAQAQDLYDERKFAAADKKRAEAMQMEDRGLALMNSKYSVYAKEQEAERQRALVGAQIPAYLASAEKERAYADYLRSGKGGRGVDTTPSPSEIKAAYDLADKQITNMMMQKDSKIKLGSPEANRLREQMVQQILMQGGKIYTPLEMGSQPLIRGTQQAPLGAR